MNKSGLLFTILLVKYVKFIRNESLTSSLPIGEYHLNNLKLLQCDPNKSNKIHFNWNLNKVSDTSFEFKGNVTYRIPFDDNLKFHAAVDIKDSLRGWLPSSFEIKKEKACSTFKSYLNTKYLKAFGWNGICPILPGVYMTSGFPAYNIEKVLSFLPIVAPYGIYKFRLSFADKDNTSIGCFHSLIEVKRPLKKTVI